MCRSSWSMRCWNRPERPSGGCGTLPSRVGVYFVLALGLYPELGYHERVEEADPRPGCGIGRRRRPRRCATCAAASARRRCRRCSRCWPARSRNRAPRGCGSAGTGRWPSTAAPRPRCPTPAANRSWLGKPTAKHGVTGYPAVELMALVETGTRALLGAVFGPPATGETDYARRLLHLLDDTMLVLCDRGFDGAAFPHRARRHGRPVPGPAAPRPAACRCWRDSTTAPTCRGSAN